MRRIKNKPKGEIPMCKSLHRTAFSRSSTGNFSLPPVTWSLPLTRPGESGPRRGTKWSPEPQGGYCARRLSLGAGSPAPSPCVTIAQPSVTLGSEGQGRGSECCNWCRWERPSPPPHVQEADAALCLSDPLCLPIQHRLGCAVE